MSNMNTKTAIQYELNGVEIRIQYEYTSDHKDITLTMEAEVLHGTPPKHTEQSTPGALFRNEWTPKDIRDIDPLFVMNTCFVADVLGEEPASVQYDNIKTTCNFKILMGSFGYKTISFILPVKKTIHNYVNMVEHLLTMRYKKLGIV